MVEKLVPNPFLKNENWAYLWTNSLNFYTVYLYCMPNWRLSKYIETNLQTTCFYFLQSFFRKQKERSGTSLPASFCAWFWKKSFSCYILLTDHIWFSGYFCFVRYWEIYGLKIVCKAGCDVINFVINLVFLIKLFFQHDQKVRTKI